ncbi:MAG: desulfoferrodoxin [Thermoplasmata archaeon]|nr:MAG: desulfoferrodoxin [Thermoplasmata archaeon]
MTERYEVYKCEICGNIVEILHAGVGELVCCGQPMKLMEEQTADTSTEKHVPFVEKEGDKIKVRIGENAKHPMEEKHYIELIEVITKDDRILRKYLKPGDEPEAVFDVTDITMAREYCNVHGLWSKKE